jgi:molybdopterin converting factor small subunit
VKVLFYGRLAEAVGRELEIGGAANYPVSELRERLAREYPELEPLLLSKRARACVADVLVDDSFIVGARDTVEFLPPVSGG